MIRRNRCVTCDAGGRWPEARGWILVRGLSHEARTKLHSYKGVRGQRRV